MNTTFFLCSVLAGAIAEQEAKPIPPVVTGEKRESDEWSQGFGRGTSFRSAMAQALGNAVAQVNGVAFASGPSIQSRLAVVTGSEGSIQAGSLGGDSSREREWVQQQVAGFVRKYEVTKKERGADRMWEVTVRALVAGLDHMASELIVELVDGDLRQWQLERYEEGGPGRAFDRKKGAFQGPKIGEFLRRSGAVKIVSRLEGIKDSPGNRQIEGDQLGQALAASHRVIIEWQPLIVRSMVEKPNKARPTSGPRPEFLQAGSVEVALRIEHLIERTTVLEETFSVSADKPQNFSADRLDAFVTQLVDKAKSEVARKIFFALRPPVVMRKWVGEGGKWCVEARISRRVANGFTQFVVGNRGSLRNPDWQTVTSAQLVGGSSASCTFRLEGVTDLSGIDVGVSQVRPVR